jgi:hypothetical protein
MGVLREDRAFVLVFFLVLVFLRIFRMSGWGLQPFLIEHDIPAPKP